MRRTFVYSIMCTRFSLLISLSGSGALGEPEDVLWPAPVPPSPLTRAGDLRGAVVARAFGEVPEKETEAEPAVSGFWWCERAPESGVERGSNSFDIERL